MSPAVLPAVSYRGVRSWQREGAKPAGQCILTPWSGREGVSRHGDCQPQGGRGLGSGGRVNLGEASLNAVTQDKPKRLTGLGQSGTWSGSEAPNSSDADGVPPAKRRDLNHPRVPPAER